VNGACKKAGSRIRTDDLLITNQLLYQLSYAGKMRRKLAQASERNKQFASTDSRTNRSASTIAKG
jgi:hypothetical protein